MLWDLRPCSSCLKLTTPEFQLKTHSHLHTLSSVSPFSVKSLNFSFFQEAWFYPSIFLKLYLSENLNLLPLIHAILSHGSLRLKSHAVLDWKWDKGQKSPNTLQPLERPGTLQRIPQQSRAKAQHPTPRTEPLPSLHLWILILNISLTK